MDVVKINVRCILTATARVGRGILRIVDVRIIINRAWIYIILTILFSTNLSNIYKNITGVPMSFTVFVLIVK